MKKVLFILGILLSVVSISKAQQGPGGGGFQRRSPEEMVKMQMERLPQNLNLNEDQKAKISAIYLSQAKSRDSLFTSMAQGGDRQAMRSKMMEMNAASDKKVLVLLTDDQQKIYNQYIQERQNRMRQGGGQRPQGGNQ